MARFPEFSTRNEGQFENACISVDYIDYVHRRLVVHCSCIVKIYNGDHH